MPRINRREMLLGPLALAGVSLLRSAAGAAEAEATEDKERQFTRVISSPASTLHGAAFRTETEDRWDTSLSIYPVSVRLRITNRSDRPLLFPLLDSYRMILYHADGAEVKMRGGGDTERPGMRPLLLEPGQDYSIVPQVQMHSNRLDSHELRIVYQDATGTTLTSDPLADGMYSVSFVYTAGERWRDAYAPLLPEGEVWQGAVTTKPVAFRMTTR